MPKVLVGIVTYEGKDYIFKENFNAVKNFEYPNYDYLYVDNSSGMSYTHKLRQRGAEVIHLERSENSRLTLAKCQNYLRQKCLDENYDYLLFIESDLLPPKDIIQRLLKHAKPVCGVIYFIGTDKINGDTDAKVPCVFFTESKQGMVGTRLIKPQEVKDFINTGLRQVHGCGFGTTLIRRDVLEKEVFWYDDRFIDKHSDVYFFLNLQRKGIPVVVDSNIIVPHFPTAWSKVKDR